MILEFAVSGYRSLREIVFCLGQLNLVTGPNGSGKSSVYRALGLVADAANGRLSQTLSSEGGLQSTLWAGPESISQAMRLGETPVEGGPRKKSVSLRVGIIQDEYSYTVDLGMPTPSKSAFAFDPVIKRECLWRGPSMRPRDLCVDRRNGFIRTRKSGGTWQNVDVAIEGRNSLLTEYVDPMNAPELVMLREAIRSWRFYDHFRTDRSAPARQIQVGTFTPALSSDGSDLASALQTIREIGDDAALQAAIADAFPGSQLVIANHDSRLEVQLEQEGMLRPLRAAELSDGTLRFLLLAAALLSPRPPECMVLNEPETSLHPDLLPALGRLIAHYAKHQQVIVVTHAPALVNSLIELDQCVHFHLEKSFGATELVGVDSFDLPRWKWPAR